MSLPCSLPLETTAPALARRAPSKTAAFEHYVVRGLYRRRWLPRDAKALICVACGSSAHSRTRIDRLVGTLATLQVWREDVAERLGPTELDALMLRLLSTQAVIECSDALRSTDAAARVFDSMALLEHRNAWALGGAARIGDMAAALIQDRSYELTTSGDTRIRKAIERATELARTAAKRYGFMHPPGRYECDCRASILPKETAREPPIGRADMNACVVNAPDPWRVPRRPTVGVRPIPIPPARDAQPEPFKQDVTERRWYVPHEVKVAHWRNCEPQERLAQVEAERRRLRGLVVELALLFRGARRGKRLVKLPVIVGAELMFEKRRVTRST